MPTKIKKSDVLLPKKTSASTKKNTKKTVSKKLPSVLMPVAKASTSPSWSEHVYKASPQPMVIKKTRPSHITFWEYSIWVSGLLVIALLVSTAYVVDDINSGRGTRVTHSSAAEQSEIIFSPLTGERVTSEVLSRRPMAVMIENLSSVRPQSGLSFADVVWEAPTEGGITRFLAIFQKGLPSKIGPVRSARPYFVEWASEVGALYAHSGGSSEALDLLAKGLPRLRDVNEFANGSAFWRESKEEAPHNLYTSAEIFYKYITDHDWQSVAGQTTPWVYISDTGAKLAVSNQQAREILVPYYPFEYDVLWRYNAADNLYTRFMDGKEHKDDVTNENIQFKNLVVMFTDVIPVPKDPLLKVNLRAIGKGTAYLFSHGQVYKGEWQKSSKDSRTMFTDGLGNYLPLTEGNTWISVVDKAQESELEYK